MNWNNKTAIVCGATAGLGREIALLLAECKVARLGLIARGEIPLEKLRSELQLQHPNLEIAILRADLVDRQHLAKAVKELSPAFGAIDLVVQAVGMSDRGTVAELSEDRLRHLLDVNVLSSLNALQLLTPRLRSNSGVFVLIGSLASLFAPRYLGGYAIAKHALAALAQQARLELAKDGKHVLLACPGPIARNDAGSRYSELADSSVPAEALQAGGGAKLRGLDSKRLAADILAAAGARKPRLIRPRSARLLLAVQAIAPSLAESILRKKTS